jgi:hypothetical protein
MQTPTAVAPPKTEPQVPAELVDAIQEVALAMQKRALYPAEHPMLRGATDRVHRRLTKALSSHAMISVTVARRHVVIEGCAVSEHHRLLADFGDHLHGHQFAALRFVQGVEPQEVDDFLAIVSEPAGKGVEPLALREAVWERRWTHITLVPLSFDRLKLAGENSVAANDDLALWLSLARVAMSGDVIDDVDSANPSLVAYAISRRADDVEFGREVIQHLTQISREATQVPKGTERLVDRVSQLVQSLPPATLAKLLDRAGSVEQRVRFLLTAVDTVSAEAALDILKVEATSRAQTISTALMRLLAKFAHTAAEEGQQATQADQTLRAQIKRLIADWELESPNPEEYNEVLGILTQHGTGREMDLERDRCEPDRVVDLALDSDAYGPLPESMLGRVVIRDGLGATLDRLMRAHPSATREIMLGRLLNTAVLREQLALERPELRVLELAIDRLGARAAEAVLEALDKRPERDAMWLSDLLLRAGDEAVWVIGDRIREMTPATQRVLLGVLDNIGFWPEGVAPSMFTRHSDASVRREAIRIMLKTPEMREQGILLGLRDPDERCCVQALQAAQRDCPPQAARILLKRLSETSLGEEHLLRVIRALTATRSPDVLQWLVAQVLTRHWFFRTPRLRRKSPEVLAALSGLAQHWSDAPQSRVVLALAARSRDEEIRRAVTGRAEET